MKILFFFVLVILVGVISINDVYALGPEDCTSDQVWQNNQCVDSIVPPTNDLNLQTDKILYKQGDVIVISGKVPSGQNTQNYIQPFVLENPQFVNAFGSKISDNIDVNQQVQIVADVKNNQEQSQKFVYIVQVKNQNGIIVSLGWLNGSLNPGQTLSPALSWTQKTLDAYVVEIFVWDVSEEESNKSWQRLNTLATPLTLSISGNGPVSQSSNSVSASNGIQDVAIIVKAPDNNIVAISQITPNADGSFQTNLKADGPRFKAPGDYTLLANFSGLKSETAFEFTGGTGDIAVDDTIPPTNNDVITRDTGMYLSATASEGSDTISVSGHTMSQITDIMFTVISPSLNVISVSQLTPDTNGDFATEFKVNPMWKENGFYTIIAEQSPHGSSLYKASLRVEVINGRSSEMEIQEKSDETEKTKLENEYSPKEREWITSGPFQIDRSQYAVGEKIFLVVKGLNTNENGEIAFMRPMNNIDYSVYLTIPFDGATKPAFNYYVEPQISKTNGINSVDDLLGDWIIVFRGTEYPNLHFEITNDVVPGTDIESDYEDLPSEITIKATLGSGSSPGCEATSQGCFIPKSVSVAAGGTIIFSNPDTVAHTFTAGTTAEGPSGEFDSSLVIAGSSYEWTPTTKGQYDYFCMLHPWMTGILFVGEGTYIPPQPEDDFDLQVIMGNSVYDLLDTATMNFSIDGTSTSQNVALEISDPRGTTVISRSFEVDSQGVSFEFRIDENFKTGTYQVVATTSDNGNTVSDTAYFKVISQYNSFKITSVQVTDQQGNPSNLQAGEIGFIKVNLEANKSITTLITVNLFDSDLTSIGIGSIKTTLSSGNSEIILSFMIPSDVSVGPADIYVNAFSDWPSNGGIPLTGEISVVENIE